MTFDEILFQQHWLLSIIFFLLLAISLFSWYIIFRKIFFFIAERKSLESFVKNEPGNDFSPSFKLLKQSSLILEISGKKQDEILEKKLTLLFEKFREQLAFGQNFLGSIANLTPFIGLFGTVIGVYLALMDISAEGNANIAVVAKPIGEALIATAIGLWCAIPAAFAFNFFSKKSVSLQKQIKFILDEKLIKIAEEK